MFVGDGAVTPGPSRECDITFFAKGRPKSAQQLRDSTVAARRAQSVTVPSSRVSRECRSPGLRSPPFKNARFSTHSQTLENVARNFSPKFHAKFHDTFGREKRRKISLPHFCRVAALTFGQPFLRTTPSPLLWRAPNKQMFFSVIAGGGRYLV